MSIEQMGIEQTTGDTREYTKPFWHDDLCGWGRHLLSIEQSALSIDELQKHKVVLKKHLDSLKQLTSELSFLKDLINAHGPTAADRKKDEIAEIQRARNDEGTPESRQEDLREKLAIAVVLLLELEKKEKKSNQAEKSRRERPEFTKDAPLDYTMLRDGLYYRLSEPRISYSALQEDLEELDSYSDFLENLKDEVRKLMGLMAERTGTQLISADGSEK